VTVEVADRGPGLPAGDEDRIFEKFYRSGAAPARGPSAACAPAS
jgi:two-component system sensor histidine kinase KdpD